MVVLLRYKEWTMIVDSLISLCTQQCTLLQRRSPQQPGTLHPSRNNSSYTTLYQHRDLLFVDIYLVFDGRNVLVKLVHFVGVCLVHHLTQNCDRYWNVDSRFQRLLVPKAHLCSCLRALKQICSASPKAVFSIASQPGWPRKLQAGCGGCSPRRLTGQVGKKYVPLINWIKATRSSRRRCFTGDHSIARKCNRPDSGLGRLG
ncbi:hypothetical protein FN846DRAFT_279832 [Sphaerosporella brunnea]|uniref:Uncharacterized protein n=1 Tax=Sphaerosporella brunnea TaxID=1250544 RepID=A0A5J5EMP7_9PEZI|nr:hypothetical protein FN846DRAFT_279832 [Sphaerosporella brunnea]